ERVGGINLGQGICDLPTIPELVEGAIDAIRSCKATYSKFEGIDLLRERIARKMTHYNNVQCDPAKEVVVTVGSSGGFAAAAMAASTCRSPRCRSAATSPSPSAVFPRRSPSPAGAWDTSWPTRASPGRSG